MIVSCGYLVYHFESMDRISRSPFLYLAFGFAAGFYIFKATAPKVKPQAPPSSAAITGRKNKVRKVVKRQLVPRRQPASQTAMLRAQLALMKPYERFNLLMDLDEDWRKKTIESYAPYVLFHKNMANDNRANEIAQAMLTSAKASEWWLATGTVEEGGRVLNLKIHYDIHVGSSSADESFWGDSICASISGHYLIDGRQQGNSASGGCGPHVRQHGDGYYLDIDSADDSKVGPYITVTLVPVPPLHQAPAEYFSTRTQTWNEISDFRWTPVTKAEYRAANEH